MPLTLQWSEDISHGQICKQHPLKDAKFLQSGLKNKKQFTAILRISRTSKFPVK